MNPEQIEVEGMRLSTPMPYCQTCGDDGDCPDCDPKNTTPRSALTPLPTGLCYICEDTAFQRNTFGPLCPWHFATWHTWQNDNTPLLAQCAALLDRCAALTAGLLGGPITTAGLINEIRDVQDEIRRARAALKEQGW